MTSTARISSVPLTYVSAKDEGRKTLTRALARADGADGGVGRITDREAARALTPRQFDAFERIATSFRSDSKDAATRRYIDGALAEVIRLNERRGAHLHVEFSQWADRRLARDTWRPIEPSGATRLAFDHHKLQVTLRLHRRNGSEHLVDQATVTSPEELAGWLRNVALPALRREGRPSSGR